MKKYQLKREMIITLMFYIFIGLISIWVLLYFSDSTSPLSIYCLGSDSAFFRYVGKEMKYGLLPYRDFFDMKGPYLFFIEYICQTIREGRVSIFAFQCVNLFISLLFVERCFDLFTKRKAVKLILILPFLAQFAVCIDSGNLTEEYSLIPILYSLYNALKYFRNCDCGEYEHKPTKALGYGIAFGVVSLIRITNAALICAVVLSILCVLIAKKRYLNILHNAIMFILGVAAAYCPIIVYYAYHGLLGEMIYQVFIFGFLYATENSVLNNLTSILHLSYAKASLIVLLLPIAASVLNRKISWYYRLFAVFASLFTLFVCSLGFPYCHYFVLVAPLTVIGGILFLDLFLHVKRGVRGIGCAALCVVTVLIFASNIKGSYINVQYAINREYFVPFVAEAEEIANAIPENERGSVFVYNAHPTWYIVSDILPYCRYVAWQDHYIELSPAVKADIIKIFEERPPLWMVMRTGTVDSEYIQSVVSNNYSVESTGEYYDVYKLKEENDLKQ